MLLKRNGVGLSTVLQQRRFRLTGMYLSVPGILFNDEELKLSGSPYFRWRQCAGTERGLAPNCVSFLGDFHHF